MLEIFKNEQFQMRVNKKHDIVSKEEVERIQESFKIFLWYKMIENNFKLID